MDPNFNLQAQLRLAAQLIREDDDVETAADKGAELAELVLALNEWITKGGFLPQTWRTEDSP